MVGWETEVDWMKRLQTYTKGTYIDYILVGEGLWNRDSYPFTNVSKRLQTYTKCTYIAYIFFGKPKDCESGIVISR